MKIKYNGHEFEKIGHNLWMCENPKMAICRLYKTVGLKEIPMPGWHIINGNGKLIEQDIDIDLKVEP